MSSPVEDRLRGALAEAGASLDVSTLRPLRAPERRRFRLDLRLVTAAVSVVVAGTALVTGLGGHGEEDRAVVANPPSPPTELAVFLCMSESPRCSGRITPEQTKELEGELRRLPQVERLTFVSQVTAFQDFRKTFAHNERFLDEVSLTDLPPSFRLRTRPGADLVRLNTSLLGMTGIENVVREDIFAPDTFTGADISAFLCQDHTAIPECGAKREISDNGDMMVTEEGKAATKSQRKAIRALIDALPEVESYVFEDQETAYENFRRSYQDNKRLLEATRVRDMPESFQITLKAGADESRVLAKLRRQPGMSQVVFRPCMADYATLSTRFGVIPTDHKACGTAN